MKAILHFHGNRTDPNQRKIQHLQKQHSFQQNMTYTTHFYVKKGVILMFHPPSRVPRSSSSTLFTLFSKAAVIHRRPHGHESNHDMWVTTVFLKKKLFSLGWHTCSAILLAFITISYLSCNTLGWHPRAKMIPIDLNIICFATKIGMSLPCRDEGSLFASMDKQELLKTRTKTSSITKEKILQFSARDWEQAQRTISFMSHYIDIINISEWKSNK